MRRGVLRAVAAVTTLVTIGCAVDNDRPAAVTAPTDALQARPGSGACDQTATLRAAKAYTSNNDPIVDIYRNLGNAITANDDNLIKTYGFDALARLAEVRNSGLGGLAADGAAAAWGTINCMQFSETTTPKEIPSELTLANLTSAFATDATGGIVEVRGGTNDLTGPVLSPTNSPLFGAETTNDGTTTVNWTWNETLGQRSFLFGYILGSAPTYFEALKSAATPFELGAVPKKNSLAHLLLVADCILPTDDVGSRLQHSNSIVKLESGAQFCIDDVGSVVASAGATGIFASAQRVLSWLSPRPAYAATMFLTPSTGGKIGSLSPNGAVNVPYSTISLTIDRIQNFKQNVSGPITVHAVTLAGNKPEDVLIKLFQSGNQGWFELTGAQGRTNANGDVTITVTFPKTGSFRLRADGYFNGDNSLATNFAVSNQFNVKP